MGLSREMYDSVNFLILHKLVEGLKVADIHLDELVVRSILDVLEIRKVASIGQLVEIYDLILRIFVDKESYNMAADETSAAGDYDVSSHIYNFLNESELISCFFSSITRSKY